jgi:hydroxymethylbilane synthase
MVLLGDGIRQEFPFAPPMSFFPSQTHQPQPQPQLQTCCSSQLLATTDNMTTLPPKTGSSISPATLDPKDPLLPPSSTATIHIGSRKSVLALIQTKIVHEALKAAWPDLQYEVHAMSTMGDKNQVTPLHNFGAKSLWTHELEAGLVEGELDLIVHSLKGRFS